MFTNFHKFPAIFINFQQVSAISIKFSHQKPSFGWGNASTLWLGQRKHPLVGAEQATLRLWKKFIENFRPGNNSKTILENFENSIIFHLNFFSEELVI